MIQGLYEFAKKWSEKGSVWMIGDTHFDDADREAMGYTISSQEQVDILKKYVHKNDTLVHLGDVGELSYLEKLPGYKVLILGNHDWTATKYRGVFDEVYEGPLVIGKKLILSHEPVNVLWAANIHGHVHFQPYENDCVTGKMNLAANVCNYTPVSLGKLIKDGLLSNIVDIHRQTVDKAIDNPIKKNTVINPNDCGEIGGWEIEDINKIREARMMDVVWD